MRILPLNVPRAIKALKRADLQLKAIEWYSFIYLYSSDFLCLSDFTLCSIT